MNTITYEEVAEIAKTKQEDIEKTNFNVSAKKFDKIVDIVFRMKCFDYIQDLEDAYKAGGKEAASKAYEKFRDFLATRKEFDYDAVYKTTKEKVKNNVQDLLVQLENDSAGMKQANDIINKGTVSHIKYMYAQYCKTANDFFNKFGEKGFDYLHGYIEENIQATNKLTETENRIKILNQKINDRDREKEREEKQTIEKENKKENEKETVFEEKTVECTNRIEETKTDKNKHKRFSFINKFLRKRNME